MQLLVQHTNMDFCRIGHQFVLKQILSICRIEVFVKSSGKIVSDQMLKKKKKKKNKKKQEKKRRTNDHFTQSYRLKWIQYNRFLLEMEDPIFVGATQHQCPFSTITWSDTFWLIGMSFELNHAFLSFPVLFYSKFFQTQLQPWLQEQNQSTKKI
eukprot:TRINITY_DN24521_c1_g1_i1.p2 TRINITY_DN24521_c1_g1~~TRINITY_DN24521_c1_g1_i1.p2  ORF type:complete len:154 (+),score=3.10 TRINITY_DN24521_c1_g1_i1:107-568(+)